MSESPTPPRPPGDGAQARRAAGERAVKLAVAGRWREAADLNRELLARFGEDAEVYNRLGKALTELGKVREARATYRKALRLDPANAIARRNLDRLAGATRADAPPPAAQVDSALFIEEGGKAAIVRLEAERAAALKALDAGDPLRLEARGDAVNALTPDGDYLGMVEPRTGLRLARLMAGGNRYSAALVSNGDPPRIVVRETFQHLSQAGKVSFPKSSAGGVRAYTRRNFLREDVEDLTDEDGGEEERAFDTGRLAEAGWSETRIEGERAVPIPADGDDDLD